jgi:hypothetical protein
VRFTPTGSLLKIEDAYREMRRNTIVPLNTMLSTTITRRIIATTDMSKDGCIDSDDDHHDS